jgi:hypothetical protein
MKNNIESDMMSKKSKYLRNNVYVLDNQLISWF